MEMKFYRCETCGQIIAVVKKTACPVMCCGKPMKEIVPGTSDGAVEKHVPVVEVDGDVVKVTRLADLAPTLDRGNHYAVSRTGAKRICGRGGGVRGWLADNRGGMNYSRSA